MGSIELPYYEAENISCNADWSIEFKLLIGPELELVTIDWLRNECKYSDTSSSSDKKQNSARHPVISVSHLELGRCA